MATLKDLKQEVERSKTVNASAIALLTGLSERLDAALEDDDENAVQALADTLRSDTDQLAAAVAKNTKASGETPVPPTEPPAEGGTTEPTPTDGTVTG